jgi:signal transduction histidine kinase
VTRVVLLLDHRENLQLLASELADRHEVVIADSDEALAGDFDLCVLDGPALDRLWENVRDRKAREQPIFLPVLMVTPRPDVKMITRQVWRSVDELLVTPIEKPELRARIEVLLRSRALSLELRRRAEDAEDAARTRDEVLAIVSHDLRNPLDLVLTSGSFLLETETSLTPRVREQLQLIHRAAGRMNRLIQDLLEVAGMEAGNFAIDARPEAVGPLVSEACETMKHAAEARQISLAWTVEEALPRVLADRNRIQQVLDNLIGNALKFSVEDGVIDVHAGPDGDRVRFSVRDGGPGIDPEDLPHVFDRFWQAKRSHAGGAGLGLAISRGIIDAHGGELRVESEPGRTTFSFLLPAAGDRES